MKTYSIFFSLFLVVSSSFSQDANDSQDIISSSGAMLYSFDITDNTIIGTPYIQEVFMPAKVSAKDGQIFSLRYNAVNDEIEIESQQSRNPTINKNISGITITFLKGNKIYKGMTYFNTDGNSVTGFLVPINSSDLRVKLFLKEKIVFVEGKPAKSSYEQAKSAKFSRTDDEYYMSVDNEIAKPLSNNKKEIAALFPKHENDILDYIKAEKLNVKKQADLVTLAAYLNKTIQ